MMGYTVSAVQISANRRTAFLLAQALRRNFSEVRAVASRNGLYQILATNVSLRVCQRAKMRLSPVPIGIGMGVCGGHCYRELRGIRLPRTRVNKGMKEGRSAWRRPRCSRRRRTRRSDTEELLLLGFEILVGDDALIPELGEPFEFAYVLGFVRSRGGSNGRSFGRF